MINVDKFIDKLEVLKVYMNEKIDNTYINHIWMDLQVCPDDWYIKQGKPLPKPYKMLFTMYGCKPFEEYYQNKIPTFT